jgi:Rrf2 family transcriptional regulator, iron-sulfur cluster assembly transcription factor
LRKSKLATLSIISRKDLLSILAVVDIAMHARDRHVPAKAVAASQGLHSRFFAQVLNHLAHRGILTSYRGKYVGGYRLARASKLISLADIVHALSEMRESPHEPAQSLIGERVVIPALAQAERKLFDALKRISIHDLVHHAKSLEVTPALSSSAPTRVAQRPGT